jgi:prepilin-type N-terminal cleavage/methylation domain-containing protein
MTGKTRAFTLIELLVVISIIALLMAIMLPALAKVKKQAKDMLCLARVRHWGLVMKIYSDEHNCKFVPERHYTDNARLMELAKFERMRYCPLATKSMVGGARHPFAVSPGADTSYGVNLWIGNPGGGGRDRDRCWLTTNVRKGYDIPMFVDCFYNDECDPTPCHWDEPPAYDGQPPDGDYNEMRRLCMDRHNEAINCAFLDFSARRVGLKELWELRWNRRWFTDPSGKPDYEPPVWPRWMWGFKDYR